MSAILHVHDALLPDPQKKLSPDITLKVMRPTSHRDKLQMSKHIGTRVCQLFDGVRHHGEVTELKFHDVHAQHVHHVVYSDGDECDYWRHELEVVKCCCDDETVDSDSDV